MNCQDLLSMAINESGIRPEVIDLTDSPERKSHVKKTSKPAFPKPVVQPPLSQRPPNMPAMHYSRNTVMNARALAEMYHNSPEAFNALIAQQAFAANGHPGMPYDIVNNTYSNAFFRNGDASALMANQAPIPGADEQEDEEEELGLAETYADYMPSKLKFGERHPDPVVETSSLSSVPPPDVWYKISIPEDVIDNALLSALQLEAITYACQQHDVILPDGNRAGFLIGDGAGVGKGRTLAGIIYENYLLGRKRSLWLSVSNDLKYDAERDLSDIGAHKIDVHALNKFKYAKISSKTNGSVKKGVVFATYSSLIGESQAKGKYTTRLKQLLHWCGEDFDGCIVFDECHKAKNLCPTGSTKPTKTGLTVLELQNKLPKARIVYASATGASEPRNMAYMTRLGLWGEGTPFKEFMDFISVVEKRGVGAMELVAMDMKLRGLYMARQLSFAGVTFKVEEIPLIEPFKKMYNQSVDLWVDAREKFSEAAELMDLDAKMRRSMWCQFWASHQRFFKYLCIASKVSHVVHLAREAVKNGKCVVIGLQSTGEARTTEQLEEQGGELNDFVSTAKGVFQSLVEKQFPAPDRKKALKLLGLSLFDEIKGKSSNDQCEYSSSTSGGVKRKPSRQAKQGAKRYKEFKMSDESSSGGSASDFEPSDNEVSVNETDDSNASGSNSDEDGFNFNDDSDSDGQLPYPWAREKVKKKKKKEQKKKTKVSEPKLPKPKPVENPAFSYNASERAVRMKQELLFKLEALSDSLPPNTLDQLIDELGGPEDVAEMTGRKGRVVSNDGTIQYESRTENDVPLETLNMTEKQRFMDGEKRIAIISEAASSGISLQSDRRVRNQARRVHMTLELPWSADRAIQQFGRTHRSNQVNAPEYLFLISDLAGERRFASIVAKRLESLGALTHGDRRATESRDLSMFNFDTKYGRTALDQTIQAVMGHDMPMVASPKDYQGGNFFYDVRNCLNGVGIIGMDPRTGAVMLEKYFSLSKFLNRILGVHVDLQNALFKYFTDTLEAVIQQAKKSGRYDLGILDLGAGGGQVKRIKCNSFMRKHATGMAKTELHTVLVERGISWETIAEKFMELDDRDEGFYLSAQTRNRRKTAVLAVLDTGRSKFAKKDKDKLFRIYRPNTGLQAKLETLSDLKSKYHKSTKENVEPHWKENFRCSKDLCSHVYWYDQCRRKTLGLTCEVGLRQRTYHVLSGSVLAVWTKIEKVLSSVAGAHNAKLQVVRLRADDKENTRIVGCLIPPSAVESLISVFSEDSNMVSKLEFN